jgi:hypothetical protein
MTLNACNFPECHVTGYADVTNLLFLLLSIDNLNTTAKIYFINAKTGLVHKNL